MSDSIFFYKNPVTSIISEDFNLAILKLKPAIFLE